MDIHLHTPASHDYQDEAVRYLDILLQAEARGLDIIAFTDHNTVAGYRQMRDEMAQLELLERLGRIKADERNDLDEYRRLHDKMLILPGFEFTATFGFHILGVFSPAMETRLLEHLLLDLNIPQDKLDQGETNVGPTVDVLAVYDAIYDAGGIAIAAHANSTHGVAMRGISFGGQTRIAYTQHPKLHALEVTDLDRKGRRTTARFFDGSKPEYPRPMRCVQGSDAHRLERDPRNPKNLGVGDRITEVQLSDLSFDALMELFNSTDLARSRPFRQGSSGPYDHVLAARQEGPSIVQSFHESMVKRGGRLYAVVADICAFANTNGGTLYVGVASNPKTRPQGIGNPRQSVDQLKNEVNRKITPPIDVEIDVVQTQGVPVIRVQVPRGGEPPYAIDDNKIYVRDETETSLAVRDEIVQLVARAEPEPDARSDTQPHQESAAPRRSQPEPNGSHQSTQVQEEEHGGIAAPRTGVEVIATETRNGTVYHHVRDLRNGNIVRNVTRKSARKLWHYAITQIEDKKIDLRSLEWQADIALIQRYARAGKMRYDLAQRDNGRIRVYYGVTEDGVQDSSHQAWRELLEIDDDDLS
ncbi:MAG: transcriptional regulator [Chloroflexi bacterium]|nr:transcriptional regulator [Chloroflexota bacterium]